MDHAEFARRMAETTQRLRQTQQQLALSARPGVDIQTFAAQTQRLARRIQAFACVMLGLSLLFAGYLVWQHVTQGTEHATLTQALRTETQTLAAQPRPCWRRCGGASPRRAAKEDAGYLGPCESGGESAPASG